MPFCRTIQNNDWLTMTAEAVREGSFSKGGLMSVLMFHSDCTQVAVSQAGEIFQSISCTKWERLQDRQA